MLYRIIYDKHNLILYQDYTKQSNSIKRFLRYKISPKQKKLEKKSLFNKIFVNKKKLSKIQSVKF